MCDGRVAPPLGKKPKSSALYVLSGIEAPRTHDLCTAVHGPRFSSASGSAHGVHGRTWHNGGLTRPHRKIWTTFPNCVSLSPSLTLYRGKGCANSGTAWHGISII